MNKKMPGGAGYTIVELLIVMAVTGALAMAAFMFISGQQAKTEFSQAVRDLESKLIDTANDVATGYFPDMAGGKGCILDNPSDPNSGIRFTLGPSEQGGSSDCIFIGKAVQFEPFGDTGAVDIFTLAGRRNSGGSPVGNLAEARPRAAYDSSLNPIFDLTSREQLLYELQVEPINPSSYVVVFLTTFKSESGSAAGTLVGSPVTELRYIQGATAGMNKDNLANLLDDPNAYLSVLGEGIRLCLTNGNQSAVLTLGGQSSKLTTNLEFSSC